MASSNSSLSGCRFDPSRFPPAHIVAVELEFMEDGHGLELPSPCSQCGYQTGILNTIPPRNGPPADLIRSHYLPSPSERAAIEADIASSETSLQTLEAEILKPQAAMRRSSLRRYEDSDWPFLSQCPECGYLWTECAANQADISYQTIKAEILKLQAAMKPIQSRRSNFQKYADSYRALLSPWRRLPDDVLEYIFSYVCDEAVNVFKPSIALWTLQQICARWRMVVRNTPLLWSKIEVISHREGVSDTLTAQSIAMKRTELCVELSKTVPLSVTLFTVGFDHGAILKGLATQAHRWKHLILDNNSLLILLAGELGRNEPLVQPGGLPCLRELALRNGVDFSIFEGANALERVSLEECTIPPKTSLLPWTNMKKLFLIRCRVTEKYDIGSLFSALHNLEELDWHGNSLDFKPMLSSVTLPSLRKASIVGFSSKLLGVISKLRVPRLTELTVEDGKYPLSDPGPLIFMIQESECKAMKLGLNIKEAAVMLRILKDVLMQYVEELSLAISPVSENTDLVLSSLEWKPAKGSAILPFLRDLTVQPAEVGYCRDLADIYIFGVQRIVLSRPAIANKAESDNLPLVPLSSLTCHVYYVSPHKVAEYDFAVGYLKRFGEERGIPVDFVVLRSHKWWAEG